MVGKWIVRWPHGIIRSKHKFDRNGLIHGEQFVYDSNGKLLKSYWMNHGTGTEYIYHDNNILHVQAEWKTANLMVSERFSVQPGNLSALKNTQMA